MQRNPARLEVIRDLLRRERQTVSVDPVADGQPDWMVQGGALANAKADYFSVLAMLGAKGSRTLFLRQTEPVLVGLLVARVQQQVAFLLAVRSEPGLIGTTCLTTTIQSTYTNYMRMHGGRATPFLEHFMDATDDAIHHDSIQYDWGDLYDGKVKRFLVVEVGSELAAPPGFVWVAADTARELLLEDHLITNDLRAILGVILEGFTGTPVGQTRARRTAAWSVPSAPEGSSSDDERAAVHHVDIDQLRVVRDGRVHFIDDAGNSVSFFRTTAASREVTSWVQPLLRLDRPRNIVLYREAGADGRFALALAGQRSVPGLRLWAPAEPSAPIPGRTISCQTSGEGGRFLHHGISIAVRTVGAASDGSASWRDDTRWLSRDEVELLVSSSRRTTLELRLAWSLARVPQHA